MSHEVNPVSIESVYGLDQYLMSPEEILAEADYQRCVNVAGLLGIEVITAQRINAWHSKLTENLMPPLSEVRRDYTAKTFTEIVSYLDHIPFDLYDEAKKAYMSRQTSLAVGGVAAIAKTSAVSELAQQPGAIAHLARGMSNNLNYFDCNVAFVNDLADLGILQEMRDPNTGEFDTSMLFYDTSHPSDYRPDPVAEKHAYTQRREHITEALRTPGLDRLIASEAGKYVIRDLVARMVGSDQYDKDGWVKDIETLVAITASDKVIASLDKIAAENPELLSLLIPFGGGASVDVEVYGSRISEVAGWGGRTDLGNIMKVATHTPWPVRMQVAAMLVSTDAIEHVKGAEMSLAEWLSDDGRDGDLATKIDLLRDSVFTKGLTKTFKIDWVMRLRNINKDHEGRMAGLLIDEGLADIALSLRQTIDSGDPYDWTFASELYVQFYKRYGVDCIDLLDTWSRTGFGRLDAEETQIRYAKESLRTMDKIEAQRPGICRTLQDDFFIRNFNRCPADMWIDQYDHRLTAGVPYFQIALSPEDHNTATQQFAAMHLEGLYSKAKRMGRHLRIYEPRTARELLTSMFRSKQRYGVGLMEIGIFMAHDYGMPVSAQLSEDVNDGVLWDIRLAELENNVVVPKAKGSGGLASVMAKNGSALVGSCSSASEATSKLNLTNATAAALGAISFGTTGNSHVRNIWLVDTADGPRIGKVDFARSDNGIVRPVIGRTYNGPSLREEAVRASLLAQA
ncbi:MAG TPA: hypothetical protein VLA92_01890 [Candidatus Saccharimonadales bacterium]|nr:hypothetical protein [Candidatus Saccharimonadales bacterium]